MTQHNFFMTGENPYASPQAGLQTTNTVVARDLTPFYSASGRFGRAAYVSYMMAVWLVFMILSWVVAVAVFAFRWSIDFSLPLILLLIALFIPAMYLSIVFMVRRLHDINWSGWGVLLSFIPPVNLIFYIAIVFFKGNDVPNYYGPPRQYVKAHGYIAAVALTLFLAGIIVSAVLPTVEY